MQLPRPQASPFLHVRRGGRRLGHHVIGSTTPPTVYNPAQRSVTVEFANVAWKYVRRGEIAIEEARQALIALLGLPVMLYAIGSVMPAAFDIACETGRSAYDCTYLALALERGCGLVTADRRFYSAMQGTPYAGTMLWVEDVP
jgi:predicted nucleic acid-binding protein